MTSLPGSELLPLRGVPYGKEEDSNLHCGISTFLYMTFVKGAWAPANTHVDPDDQYYEHYRT